MVLFAKTLTLMYGVQTRSVQSIINPSPVRFRSARRATVQLFGLSHVKPFKQRYTSCKLTAGEQLLFDNDVIQITGMADSVKQGQESLAFRSVGIYIVLSAFQKMALYSTKAKHCRPQLFLSRFITSEAKLKEKGQYYRNYIVTSTSYIKGFCGLARKILEIMSQNFAFVSDFNITKFENSFFSI